MHELPDTDLANVFEVMTAEIHRRDLGREPTCHVADEHLTAVTSRRHPSSHVKRHTDVVITDDIDFARVHPHSDPDHHILRPHRLPQPNLRITTAAIAGVARSKATNIASPSVPNTTPPSRVNASARIRLC